jgi:hypothetical protein
MAKIVYVSGSVSELSGRVVYLVISVVYIVNPYKNCNYNMYYCYNIIFVTKTYPKQVFEIYHIQHDYSHCLASIHASQKSWRNAERMANGSTLKE